jgi:benzoate/toluate 1,2-dioxygenase alpha subunit
MTTVMAREERDATEGLLRTEVGRIQGKGQNGCYDLGNGHIVLWTDRSSPEVAPLYPAKERIERDFPTGKARWMLDRGRNILIFPNMVLNDLASTHLRTHRPLSPEMTEVTIWCVAPVGEERDARNARLRKFEDFFLVTGMSTSDDIVSLDVAQEGLHARAARWNDFSRGVTEMFPGPDDAARELGIDPAMTGKSWDHESTHACWYRHWKDLLGRGMPGAVAAE